MGLRFKNTNIIGMVLIMKLKNLLLLLGVVTICSSCIGDTDNPTISAKITGGVCRSMTTADTCSITLTYNTGGQSGLIFSISSGNIPSNYFNLDGLNNCSTTNTSNTCTVTVTYLAPSDADNITEDLVFALGSAKSNAITISN